MPKPDLSPGQYGIEVARQSDAIQTSIPKQFRLMDKVAEQRSIPIPDNGRYSDIESRSNEVTGWADFQAAMERAKDPNCRYVIFWNDSRLLGSPEAALKIIKQFRRADVRVLYSNGTEEDVQTRLGELMAMFKGWKNEGEVIETRTRVRETLRDMAEQGRMISRPPYGVRVVTLNDAPCGGSCGGDPKRCSTRHGELSKKNTVWIVDEDEIANLTLMYQHMADGNTWGSLEKRLATADIKTRVRTITRSKTNVGNVVGGTPLLKHSLKRWLTNPFYMGTFTWNQTEIVRDGSLKESKTLPRSEWVMIPHALGPLVDPDLWERANQQIERRSNTREDQRAYPPLLWDGFIFDGRCGWQMSPKQRNNRTKTFGALGGSKFDYTCHGTYNIYCRCTENHVIPDLAIDYHLGSDLTASRLMPHLEVTFEAESEHGNPDAELTGLAKRIVDLEVERENTLRMEQTGRFSPERAEAEHSRIDADLAAASQRQSVLLAAPTGDVITDKVPDVIRRLFPLLRDESIPLERRRLTLSRLIDRIIIDRPRMRVVLRKEAVAEMLKS